MTRAFLSICLLLPWATAAGQWSSTASANLAVSDSAGEQVLPVIVPSSDGSSYVSWLDAASTGHDVRLQRLDVAGNELWGHGGVLVSDQHHSVAHEYDLAIDESGRALLVFVSDVGLVTDAIVAARVSTDGTLDWGNNGVLISAATQAALSAPRISAVAPRGIVAAWTEGSEVVASGLNSAGLVAWTHRESPTPGGSLSLVEMRGTGDGTILSMVSQSVGTLSSRHLRAIKLSAGGTPMWPGPVSVFDGGSLHDASLPGLTPDGAGGGLFAFAAANPQQAYVQHVRFDGSIGFPHNGSPVSANSAQVRHSPSLAFDAFGGNIYVFWEEQDPSQALFGVSGQKFDLGGQPQWAAHGETLIPLSTTQVHDVRTVANSSGAFVFWSEIAGIGTDVLRGGHVDGAGVTDVGPFEVANVPSVKRHPSATLGASGQALIAWSDARADAGDILVQNVNGDGSLGNLPLGTPSCFGVACPCANSDPAAGCRNSSGLGGRLFAVGTTSVAADNLLLFGSQFPASELAILFAGAAPVGGGTGQALGGGLLCVGAPIHRIRTTATNLAGDCSWGPGLMASGAWTAPGNTRLLQAWYRDGGAGSCAAGTNISHALMLGFGQ